MFISYTSKGVEIDNSIFLPLHEIIDKCNDARITENDLVLLKIEWIETRNSPEIIERIVLPRKNIQVIRDYILGKTVYFGEIHGKHSNIYGIVEIEDIEETDDTESIKEFLRECPEGHEYNHSFLFTFYERACDGEYEEYENMTDENYEEFINNVYNMK